MTLEYIEIIKSFVTILGFPFTVIGIYLVYSNIKMQRNWNKKNKSFEYSFSEKEAFIKISRELDATFDFNHSMERKVDVSNILDELNDETEVVRIKNNIQIALGRLEAMAIAIKHGVADEDICRDMLETRVIRIYPAFRDYVESVRDSRGNQKLYHNLEVLSERWSNNIIPSSNPY